jgi:hypothetical protein
VERPRGVTLLAVLSFLTALNALLAGILLLAGLLDLRAISFLLQIATLVMYLFGMIAGCGSHALAALALFLQIPPNLFFIPEFLIAVLYGAIGLGAEIAELGALVGHRPLHPRANYGGGRLLHSAISPASPGHPRHGD